MEGLRSVIGAAILLAACDAAASGRISIVSEQQAAESWTPAPGLPRVLAGYPAAAGDARPDVCVNIGYLIDKDGKTSNFTQMKAWSSAAPEGRPEQAAMQPFVQSAAAAVSMWRFVPVGAKPRSIYTSASFAFAGSKALGEEEIRSRCRIDDLAGFVARAKAEQDRRGDLAHARDERLRSEREQVEPMGTNYR